MPVPIHPRPFTTDKDISSAEFWARSFVEREETFGWLRKNAPVSWHPPLQTPELLPEVHGEPGFWAVVRAEDVAFVSRNHEMFSSDSKKHGRSVMFRPTDPSLVPSPTFLTMDPPEHTRYRRIMSAGFTPKAVNRLRGLIEQRAARIVDRVMGAGEIDFVTEVSAKLPMMTVADLVGVPEELVETFAEAGDRFVGADDPEINGGTDRTQFAMQQIRVLREIGLDLVRHRRTHPTDDIATALAQAEFDGKPLSDDDIQSAMLLLSVAGNDTTKQTTSHSVVQLWKHPDQKAWLTEDFDGRIAASIEEFIRHASPVVEFARTATQDLELGGQEILAGDKVVVFYASANRDEEVFDEPHRFDLRRTPVPHYGFGGGGVHFCLGNGIAKAQLRALFSNILTKLPDMRVGEPEMLQSEFIHGIRHLPVVIPN